MDPSCKLRYGTRAPDRSLDAGIQSDLQAGAESLLARSVAVKQAAWWSGCAGPGRGGKAEVLKNGAAGFARREYGEDAHAAAAGVADQDVDCEHALEQVGPVEPTTRGRVGPSAAA
jgi:hypothetical protein